LNADPDPDPGLWLVPVFFSFLLFPSFFFTGIFQFSVFSFIFSKHFSVFQIRIR